MGSTINPNRHLRYVKGFRKTGAANIDQQSEKDSARYFWVSPVHYEDDPGDLIERVVTQVETSVHDFDPESKMQSKHWKHPGSLPAKKFKRVHSAGKVMASIFSDRQEGIMIDYLEQGRTMNIAYYAGELRQLRQEARKSD